MASLVTRAVHAGRKPDGDTGAILTPIHQVTTYAQEDVGVHKGHTYSRASNPTVEALEIRLNSLEEGIGAVAFTSGMAAIDALFRASLSAGDHVVVSDVVYGGTVRLLRQVYARAGVTWSFVDASDPAAVARAITPATKLVLLESPGNPTLKLADIRGVAEVAHAKGVPVAVDNTFLTPLGQRVFELGADISVHSTTKYLEGHNSTIGGAVIVKSDAALLEQLKLIRKTAGSNQAPFEAWLTLRGIKTLALRLDAVSSSAQAIAEYLEQSPGVAKVHYPGLASFPQRDLAERQQLVTGGILAFELDGGYEAALRFVKGLEWITLAENLGAAESLLTHPASMTHAALTREEREALGITDGLLRLSVGLEAVEDLVADLESALARARAEVLRERDPFKPLH
ncbi:MAG TPA: PLP-dependent aspartate aminotransferase family protein, partial [Candidatus Thermoplasmatota archaeon]|nr:PLP-dependent aspartate aminotransferase family protein [Candidatus Thermoplasmatota archaeon]